MKKMWAVMLISGLASLIEACPTCVNSSYDYTPPFFSDEYYHITEEQDAQVMRSRSFNAQEKVNNEETDTAYSSDNN